MEIYELKRKKGQKSSMYAIALVKNPAIEVGFVALSEEQELIKYHFNAESRMLYSPMLIPNQKILRKKEDGTPFQIYFSEDTIKEVLYDFQKAKLQDNFNSEHNEAEILKGVSVVEAWIVDDPKNDKSSALGFDLPKGTAMLGIEVTDKESLAKIESDEYQGISIEGYFDDYITNLSKTDEMKDINGLLTTLTGMVTEIKEKLGSSEEPKKFESVTAEGGVVIYFEGELSQGVNVYADEAMEVPLEDNTYSIDGQEYVVSGGIVQDAAEMEMKATEEKAEELLKAQEELIEKHEELAKEATESKEKVEALEKEVTEVTEAKAEIEKENEALKAELSALKAAPAAKSAHKFTQVSNKSNSFVELREKTINKV